MDRVAAAKPNTSDEFTGNDIAVASNHHAQLYRITADPRPSSNESLSDVKHTLCEVIIKSFHFFERDLLRCQDSMVSEEFAWS